MCEALLRASYNTISTVVVCSRTTHDDSTRNGSQFVALFVPTASPAYTTSSKPLRVRAYISVQLV